MRWKLRSMTKTLMECQRKGPALIECHLCVMVTKLVQSAKTSLTEATHLYQICAELPAIFVKQAIKEKLAKRYSGNSSQCQTSVDKIIVM
ncbi:hypothetical protein AC249_AIPGENE5184 [Exaiptasia diaphana]|nr:hypothetical protein AC249_AIPGENE5184 [Exaiptasia diaphana]